LVINIEPRKEGSLIDIFTIAINNPAITTSFTALIAIFATKFFDAKFSSAIPKTEETSKKLDNIQKIKEYVKNGTLTETDFDYIASNDRDLKKQKSNFFKTAKKELLITKIEATTNTEKSQPIIVIVERKDFDSFILPETTESTDETKDAKIYIAAPILIKVKGIGIFWKGIYENNPIDFRVSDKEFLEQVRSQTIQFRNGTYINCELKITVKTNIETEETKISREVTSVSNWGDDEIGFKQILHKKKTKKDSNIQQLLLFNGMV
jgi:hypothetical protein